MARASHGRKRGGGINDTEQAKACMARLACDINHYRRLLLDMQRSAVLTLSPLMIMQLPQELKAALAGVLLSNSPNGSQV